ncbi:ATP-binding cassette domain-containing protein [Dolichospermum compactum]|uniref:Uncharacterized protein n=1 Tax=Dolichospermum compactum NIES-806 TaxID=1973481 RepID=A0A1Z4VAM6_9CYAN|nr:ABC transporter ATP-binding protein [Dolichospermum compactum]BAZ88478.1 hypothetical protein NIES806_47160 [Dolichospermum compactum NIES-806]
MYTYKLNRIIFNNGLELQPGNITVIIGPNNAGKSRALKDIAGKTTKERSLQGIVVTDVEWTSPASLQEIRDIYNVERYQDENGSWMFRTLARTYATGTLVGCVKYQQSVYLQDLCSLTHPTTDFWCDTCVSPKSMW